MSSILLEDVCLDYLVKTGSDSLKRTLMLLLKRCTNPGKTRTEAIKNSTFRALNNLNLHFKTGDRIGILGRNGAGKSSLLRVLAKVYTPSSGRLQIEGKLSSLFDVNLGMNSEATGYENIINLSVMRGASIKQAKQIIDEVEAFTELGRFLNHPVRTYSTGMQMKLAFAVATSYIADILLIDEIIGTGDTLFMEKASQRIADSIARSNILVLTSHSTEIITKFCNKVLVLEQGSVRYFGDVATGIALYEQAHNKGVTTKDISEPCLETA